MEINLDRCFTLSTELNQKIKDSVTFSCNTLLSIIQTWHYIACMDPLESQQVNIISGKNSFN